MVSKYPYARVCDHALNTSHCRQSFKGDMLNIYMAMPQNCKVLFVIGDYGRVLVRFCYVQGCSLCAYRTGCQLQQKIVRERFQQLVLHCDAAPLVQMRHERPMTIDAHDTSECLALSHWTTHQGHVSGARGGKHSTTGCVRDKGHRTTCTCPSEMALHYTTHDIHCPQHNRVYDSQPPRWHHARKWC